MQRGSMPSADNDVRNQKQGQSLRARDRAYFQPVMATPNGNYIAVSGNMGSGKSTLSNALVRVGNWSLVGATGADHRYLEDLFTDPARWSFEVQLQILTRKVMLIRQALRRAEPFVIERSLYEDIEIFAEHFRSTGAMSERSYETYRRAADLLLEDLPAPSLTILCFASSKICAQRIMARNRAHQNQYPPDHISTIGTRYLRWWPSFSRSERAILNTETHDLLDFETQCRVVDEIRCLYNMERKPKGLQLDLFDQHPLQHDNDAAFPESPDGFVLLSDRASTAPTSVRRNQAKSQIYFASAFTAATSPSVADDAEVAIKPAEFFVSEAYHGKIEPGPYRIALERAAGALQRRGYRVLLPHRDINRWGKRHMSPKQVALECLSGVKSSQLFVAVLGASYGAHTELGTAIGIGLPVILFVVEGNEPTFFGDAVAHSGLVEVVHVADIGAIAKVVSSKRWETLVSSAYSRSAEIPYTLDR